MSGNAKQSNRSPWTLSLGQRGGLLLGILCLVLVGQLDSVQAQNQKAAQTHLDPIEGPIKSLEDPPFILNIKPKKKKLAPIVKRWRVVDRDARRDDKFEEIAKALEEERKKDPQDEERIRQIEAAERREAAFWRDTKMLLEVDGNPMEAIRVTVTKVPLKAKINEIHPKSNIVQNWEKVKVLKEIDRTSKSDRKKGRLVHHLEVVGTPPNSKEKIYLWIDTYSMLSKDKNRRMRVMYIHQMPESKRNEESTKEMMQIVKLFRA